MRTNVNALYVEDDDSAYFLVQTALSEANLPVKLVRASDGDEAIASLKQASNPAMRPDVVLLDLNLPRVSGFDVLAHVRKDESLHHLPVVVLTTSAVPRDRDRALQLGAEQFFTKPVTFDGLIDLMNAIFRPMSAESRSTTAAS